MPTIDCALNSAPVNECEDSKNGFIVALVFFWALAKPILKSLFRRHRPSGDTQEDAQESGKRR